MMAVGIYRFSKNLLKAFRDTVSSLEYAADLSAAIEKVVQRGYQLGGKTYKQIPRGYRADSPYRKLLLYSGMYGSLDMGIPDIFYTPEIVDACVQVFRDMLPIHGWLLNLQKKVERIE